MISERGNLPILGFGTYKIDDAAVVECVLTALECGYRRIDTATFYNNESGIGRALSRSGLARRELYLTTKLWTDVQTRDDVNRTVEQSLSALGTDYIDLLLIHWPTAANATVWAAMEELCEQGIIGRIGVSNFKEHHIEELKKTARIMPTWNQVEMHPYFRQQALRNYCEENGITVEAWSPLMRGGALDDEVIVDIGAKYGKSAAAVILRADIQEGIAVIPKSINAARIKENFDIFDFELDGEDLNRIAALDRGLRKFRDPDNHGF